MYLTQNLFKEDTKFMKFNKSHILLISLISIFLLLSIGAASAASDANDIASDIAIDDITEIDDIDNNMKDIQVLSQGEENSVSDEVLGEDDPNTPSGDDPVSPGGEGGDETVVDSINTTIEASNKTYAYGENITVNFTLKDNESNPINNTTKSNFKVFYKNESEESFNKTLSFSINNESQFVFNRMAAGNYLLKIQFLNSTIDDKNYTESETIVSLNITKAATTINASVAKVKLGDEVLIPFKIYIGPHLTLNVNASRLNVTCNGEEINFTNMTGGDNVTNGIRLTNFTGGTGNHTILIKYLGNDNCDPSNTTITLKILNNNTMYFYEDVAVDFSNYNITIPISVNNTSIVNYTEDGVNKTNVIVTTLNLTRDNITLELVYDNGTNKNTIVINDFDWVGDDGKYNITFIPTVPLNDAKLSIIYANDTLDETSQIIAFAVTNNMTTNVTSLNVNNHTRNLTVPIGIQQTVKVSYDGKNITNTTLLNFTGADVKLLLVYNNGTENVTVAFDLSGENGTYDLNCTIDGAIDFDNATLTITYAEGTLNETIKNITLKAVLDLIIVPVNVSADYQDGYFIFKVLDAIDNTPMADTNITVSGLLFYTFGNGTSLSGSKIFATDGSGLLKIKNENMNPNLDLTGYSSGFVALPVGNYNLTFRAGGSLVLDNTSEITVNKVQAKIVASDLKSEFGNLVTYSYKLVNAKTNAPIRLVNVLFRVYAGNFDATRAGLTNMTGFYTSPNLNLTANTYSLKLSTNNTNVVCSPVSKTLTITKKLATITAKNRTVYYGATNDIIATVKDKKTGKVMANTYVLMQIYNSSKKSVTYAVLTDSKGVVRFSPPTALKVGKHKVLLTVLDNNYNSSVLTRYITVKKASGKFSASNVKTYYRSGKLFKIKLINSKTKKGIYGAKVNIKVFIAKNKFYNYTGTTGATGLVQFKIGYKPGTYKVVIGSADKGYSAKNITRKIKVTKHPIKFKPTSLKVKKGKYFKVKVISKKNKKALSKVKVKIRVYTGKKYKTYTKKTNKKGIASLKITQKAGKHKVVIMNVAKKLFTAKKLTKTIKVTK